MPTGLLGSGAVQEPPKAAQVRETRPVAVADAERVIDHGRK
jgi:hypothetical protein